MLLASDPAAKKATLLEQNLRYQTLRVAALYMHSFAGFYLLTQILSFVYETKLTRDWYVLW